MFFKIIEERKRIVFLFEREAQGRVTRGFLCLYVVKSDHASPIFFDRGTGEQTNVS
jgi:hypothetical protein